MTKQRKSIFTCYANILDHLENIRDKKILILEERDRHLGMIGVVNQLIQKQKRIIYDACINSITKI